MALVKNPLGGIAASGSVGGTTFARNRAGQYARAWAKPVNPASSRQTVVRNQFGLASTTWGMLDEAAVAAWDAYAATLIRLNKLGEPYTPKGRQIYMEANQNLQQADPTGASMIAAPGPTTETPAITALADFAVQSDAGVIDEFSFFGVAGDFPGGETMADNFLILEASPAHDPKLQNVNNQFRQIWFGTLADLATITDATYSDVFGTALLPGQIIDIRYYVIDKATGFASPQIKTSAVVTETP